MTPSSLGGRYRILRSLGAGGMGEVFLARDQKLARAVAIKRLTPRHEEWARRRERFRREARIAAQIEHAAVVSVFDVIEDDDTDYIVMEYVDGTTMRVRIADGPPLTLNQVLHLGCRIAAGMAKAHELGIVHRDLKTENVLISRTGDVKIADFGIAKVPGEDSLTEEGTVVGTYKAMSPEQALGADVDYRTDLFSFGVLLYEAFAGVPPFTGRSSEEIRGAVLRSDPPPLVERRPDLPLALLNLIGQLLQKARDLRPAGGFPAVQAALSELGTNGPDEILVEGARSPGHDDETLSVEQPESNPAQADTSAPGNEATAAPDAPRQKATTQPVPTGASESKLRPRRRPRVLLAIVLGTVLAGLAFAWWQWRSAARRPVPVDIAVDPPITSGCADSDRQQVEAVQHAIKRALMELEGVSVVRGEVPETGVPAVRNAYILEASRLLVRISCHPGYLNTEIERIDPDGRVIPPSERFPLEIGEIGRTRTAIEHHIQRIFPGRAAQAGIHPDDLDHFLRLLRAYWQDDPSPQTERILDELADIRARSPKLVDAYRLEAEIWHHRYMTSRDEKHYESARDLLAAARELAPASQLVISGVVALELDHGDVAAAEAVLSELEELSPASGLTMYLRALVLQNQGHLQQARDMLETAVQRHPSWRIFYHLAKLEYQLGNIAAARRHLDRLLALSPENRAGKALQAVIALYTDQDTSWCQERLDSSDLARVNGCAVKLMEKQHYGAAALLLERARKLGNHAETAFNLGEALLLAGEREQAAGAFRDVLDLIDPETSTPRSLATRAMAMAHLGRLGDARQTIAQAVASSPDDANVRYAAAATYALLGDDERTVGAILATPASFGSGDFGYPWFDFVRKDARLRDRLSAENTAGSPK